MTHITLKNALVDAQLTTIYQTITVEQIRVTFSVQLYCSTFLKEL